MPASSFTTPVSDAGPSTPFPLITEKYWLPEFRRFESEPPLTPTTGQVWPR